MTVKIAKGLLVPAIYSTVILRKGAQRPQSQDPLGTVIGIGIGLFKKILQLV